MREVLSSLLWRVIKEVFLRDRLFISITPSLASLSKMNCSPEFIVFTILTFCESLYATVAEPVSTLIVVVGLVSETDIVIFPSPPTKSLKTLIDIGTVPVFWYSTVPFV